jgi:hypothetical protein
MTKKSDKKIDDKKMSRRTQNGFIPFSFIFLSSIFLSSIFLSSRIRLWSRRGSRVLHLPVLPAAGRSRVFRSAAAPRPNPFRRPPRISSIPLPLHPSSLILHPSKKPGPVQMDVGQKQRHRSAFGDLPGFVQVALRALRAGARPREKPQPGAGEEGARDVVRVPARRRPDTAWSISDSRLALGAS